MSSEESLSDVETDNGWTEVDGRVLIEWRKLEPGRDKETPLIQSGSKKEPYAPYAHTGTKFYGKGKRQYIGRYKDPYGKVSFVGPVERGIGLHFLPKTHETPDNKIMENGYDVLIIEKRSIGEWPVEWNPVGANRPDPGYPLKTDIKWNGSNVYVGMDKDAGIGMACKVSGRWAFYGSSTISSAEEFYILCSNC